MKSKRDVNSALRTVPAGVPAEFIFLVEAKTPAPAPAPAPAPVPTTASTESASASSDPDKAALLQVRINLLSASLSLCDLVLGSEHGSLGVLLF